MKNRSKIQAFSKDDKGDLKTSQIKKSMSLKILVDSLIFSDFPYEKLTLFVSDWQDWSIIQIHNVHAEKFTLKLNKKVRI